MFKIKITNIFYTMDDFDLKLAFHEYDIAISNINIAYTYGFAYQIKEYENQCSKAKFKETYKLNVMFQTDFLEETYKDFLFNNKNAEFALKKLSNWHFDLLNKNEKSIDWNIVIFSANPNNLEEILSLHSDKMSDEVYWQTIAHCYRSSNLGHSGNNIISNYLNKNRPNKHFLMDENERKFLAELPEKITIYRGCSKKEIISKKIRYSWTLDKKVAEFFAYEYSSNGLTQSLDKVKSDFDVIEKTINKSEVIAYFNGRQESEILYYPKK